MWRMRVKSWRVGVDKLRREVLESVFMREVVVVFMREVVVVVVVGVVVFVDVAVAVLERSCGFSIARSLLPQR